MSELGHIQPIPTGEPSAAEVFLLAEMKTMLARLYEPTLVRNSNRFEMFPEQFWFCPAELNFELSFGQDNIGSE